ncbi:MAG: hypothetical protein NTY22_09490 [Proteobacteria bacterium]|nr:hypothetical protein [Pseudomonadota bacterium]
MKLKVVYSFFLFTAGICLLLISYSCNDVVFDFGSFYVTSGQQGNISITMKFPSDISNYKTVSIYRLEGSTVPKCGEGVLVKEITDFSTNPFVQTDTGLTSGAIYSYRACIATSFNYVVSMTSSSEAGHIIPEYLTSFTATSGGVGTGIISINLDYPADTSTYQSISIYRLESKIAPTCGAGTLVTTVTSYTPDPISIPDSGLNFPSAYSYTACIKSLSGYILPMTAYCELQ